MNEVVSLDNSRVVSRCVVRVRTSAWTDKSGLHQRKSITYLRRLSLGFNLIKEDSDSIGAQEVIAKVVNLGSCPDGVYEVVPCNERRDWEYNHVEDYDYRLVPFKDQGCSTSEPTQVLKYPPK